MFGNLVKDLVGVVEDVATIAAAPVAVVASAAREVTAPVADAVRDALSDSDKRGRRE